MGAPLTPHADGTTDAATRAAFTARGRPVPAFRALTHDECIALLARHHVGRLAYAHHTQVGIVPIHYVYHDGWLYGRTEAGAKLAALRHHPWVAFEVDEIHGAFAWQSVVVRGAFYIVDHDGPQAERARWDRATALLRQLIPDSFTPDDPTPQRDVVFRIHLGEVTGRAARPG